MLSPEVGLFLLGENAAVIVLDECAGYRMGLPDTMRLFSFLHLTRSVTGSGRRRHIGAVEVEDHLAALVESLVEMTQAWGLARQAVA